MLLQLSPNQDQIQTALVSFLSNILPDGDAVFVASINDTSMLVTSVLEGEIAVGDPVLGFGVAYGTTVSGLSSLTDDGQSYIVSPSQTVVSMTMSTGVAIVEGQDNRVSQSSSPDQVILTVIRRARIETNVDEYADCAFTASITGTVMTVSNILMGTIEIGAQLFGSGLAPGSVVVAQLGGTGGIGTYSVSPSQVAVSQVMATGVETLSQPTEVVYQLDVHGPSSSDNAQIITTIWRDQRGVDLLTSFNPNVFPLYCDEPRQVPFQNAESQWEYRWVIEAHLQANQTVALPQQFADVLDLTLINAETLATVSTGLLELENSGFLELVSS